MSTQVLGFIQTLRNWKARERKGSNPRTLQLCLHHNPTTPIKPQIHKAANMQELESSFPQHCINYLTLRCVFPLSFLLHSWMVQGLQDHRSVARTQETLRKTVGLSCSQSLKHLRLTTLSLNQHSEVQSLASGELFKSH